MRHEENVEIRRDLIKCAEILYRSVDEQLEDFKSTLQRLSSALSPYSDNLPEPVAKYIVAQIRDDLERWRRTYGGKGKPDQPRDELGQWTSTDASGSGGTSKPAGDSGFGGKSSMDIDDAVEFLNDNAEDESTGYCAVYVNEAIRAGGVKLERPFPTYAKLYGPYLEKYKFEKITPTPEPDYSPQKGDIAVFQPPPVHKNQDGHIQMYNGEEWVSDFKQGKDKRNFWPGLDYRLQKPPYAIYRP